MTLAHSPQQNRCLCLEVTAPSAPLQCEGHPTKCPRRDLLQERAVHRWCGSPPENSSWCFGIMKHSRELKSYLGEHLPRINHRFMWSRFLCSPRSQDEASPIRMSPCQISIAPYSQILSLESIPRLKLRDTGGRNLWLAKRTEDARRHSRVGPMPSLDHHMHGLRLTSSGFSL